MVHRRTNSSILRKLAVLSVLLTLAQFLDLQVGASRDYPSKSVSLNSIVVSTMSGFQTEPTDKVGGGRTGRIAFSEVASADCDPSGLTRAAWEASVLRYFDDSTLAPQTYLILCVTQLRTSGEAVANRNRVLALGEASQSAAVRLPGTFTRAVGPALQLFFAKGSFFVWIVATSLSAKVKVLPLATSLAHREYMMLPK